MRRPWRRIWALFLAKTRPAFGPSGHASRVRAPGRSSCRPSQIEIKPSNQSGIIQDGAAVYGANQVK
jgi:hypothetical protein